MNINYGLQIHSNFIVIFFMNIFIAFPRPITKDISFLYFNKDYLKNSRKLKF